MTSNIDELERLSRLRDSGALSETEFQSQKAQLLSGSRRGKVIWVALAVGGLAAAALLAFFLAPRIGREDSARQNELSANSQASAAPSSAPTASPPSARPDNVQGEGGEGPTEATFPLDNHSFAVAVTELRGANSSTASMVGVPTANSISEWCSRNPGGISGGRQGCIRQTMSEQSGQRYRVTANCQRRTIANWDGESFRYVASPEAGWIDLETGDLLTASNGGLSADVESRILQFNILCPLSAISVPSE